MSIVAFVPARSGSKRLPGKNLKLLGGKPLVIWTLECFARAPSIDRIIFSTDSEDYWETAQAHLPDAPLMWDRRTAEEAGDTVTVFNYVKAARDKLFTPDDTAVVVGLPTAPLRRVDDVEAAVALYHQHAQPVFSACAFDAPVSFGFRITEDGGWAGIDPSEPLRTGKTRSQDQAPAYHPNGAIYIRPVQDFRRDSLTTFFEGARPYIMSRADSVDIDTPYDFALAEAALAFRDQNPKD